MPLCCTKYHTSINIFWFFGSLHLDSQECKLRPPTPPLPLPSLIMKNVNYCTFSILTSPIHFLAYSLLLALIKNSSLSLKTHFPYITLAARLPTTNVIAQRIKIV